MNLRIQELAEQAGFYVADGKIYIPSTSEEITTCQKKFAELIVRECMSVADLSNNASGQWDHLLPSEVIGKHFGVDE
jgi:hypothetical protein